jgi:hypothetical protein
MYSYSLNALDNNLGCYLHNDLEVIIYDRLILSPANECFLETSFSNKATA